MILVNYKFDIGVKKDAKKAFKYYKRAAELGNSDAMHDVGDSQNISVTDIHSDHNELPNSSSDTDNGIVGCPRDEVWEYF
ncbi:hypothetical protein C2G38_2158245 [Gigaspora rosea]|uniref:Uncharacterized protein n=1 Tax=Gigaspora rosea TaxID=44941 RepID=A0A397W4V6_9GLOM|nr:hypothetical protein C2G38_2158245 [Gigaspora rosea]